MMAGSGPISLRSDANILFNGANNPARIDQGENSHATPVPRGDNIGLSSGRRTSRLKPPLRRVCAVQFFKIAITASLQQACIWSGCAARDSTGPRCRTKSHAHFSPPEIDVPPEACGRSVRTQHAAQFGRLKLILLETTGKRSHLPLTATLVLSLLRKTNV
jgi:hypothetical protein